MTAKTEEQKIEMMARHAYHPFYNSFGYVLSGKTFEERFAALEIKLAERAKEDATVKAAMMARYN